MLSKEIKNKTLLTYSYEKLESTLSFAIVISLISLFTIVIFIGYSFPLEKKVVRNIIFENKSNSNYRVIANKKITEEIVSNIIENYIYYRESYPIQKNLLIHFETKNIYEKRKNFEKKFLKIIKPLDSYKRNIKIESVNFLLNNSFTANIIAEDYKKQGKQDNLKKKEFQIVLKYQYFNYNTTESKKYINPLGLKITNYEIKNK